MNKNKDFMEVNVIRFIGCNGKEYNKTPFKMVVNINNISCIKLGPDMSTIIWFNSPIEIDGTSAIAVNESYADIKNKVFYNTI